MKTNIERYTRHAAENYQRLSPFIAAVDALEDKSFIFHAEGFMPLAIEYIYRREGIPVFSMMHYYRLNGDLMRDPEMTFTVDHDGRKIIPLTFQQDGVATEEYGTLYQNVFPQPGMFSPKLLTDLDSFLSTWTSNIISQGFSPDEPQPAMSLEEFTAKYSKSS